MNCEFARDRLFYQLHDIIHDEWKFSHGGAEHKIKMSGNRASHDGDLIKRWCVAGKCLAVKPCIVMVYHFAVSLGLTRFSRLPPKQTSEKFGDNSKKRVERALGGTVLGSLTVLPVVA